MRHIKALAFLSMVLMVTSSVACQVSKPSRTDRLNKVERWFNLSHYPTRQESQNIPWNDYDMAILGLDDGPPLEEAAESKCLLVAYVSFGEAESYQPYWEKIKDKPWIIKKRLPWKDSYLVDVRNPEWQELILREIIPQAVSKGFHGIFMDTLDTASYLEGKDHLKYAGAKKAAIDLVRKAHGIYPDLYLISNNAYEILPQIAPYLRGVLVEGINSQLDVRRRGGEIGFKKMETEKRRSRVKILKKIQQKYGLPVFALDYAPPEDRVLVRQCVEASRQLGFKPYVAGKERDRLYEQG